MTNTRLDTQPNPQPGVSAHPNTTRIGVISDTHGYLPDAVSIIFEMCKPDLILHAGDIGSPAILMELELLAPTLAVRGNNDFQPAYSTLPATLRKEIGTTTIFMAHTPNTLRTELAQSPLSSQPYLVGIHGHTHIPEIEQQNERITILCPGSPAYPRARSKPSIALLELTQNNAPKCRIIEL